MLWIQLEPYLFLIYGVQVGDVNIEQTNLMLSTNSYNWSVFQLEWALPSYLHRTINWISNVHFKFEIFMKEELVMNSHSGDQVDRIIEACSVFT